MVGGEAVEGVIVRVQVEDMGGGGVITYIMDPKIGDTTTDLKISVRIPLFDSAQAPACSRPVIEDNAADKVLGGIKGLKGLGIGWG